MGGARNLSHELSADLLPPLHTSELSHLCPCNDTHTHFTLIHHRASCCRPDMLPWTLRKEAYGPCARAAGLWGGGGGGGGKAKLGSTPDSDGLQIQLLRGLSKSQTERTPHLCLPVRINVCACSFVSMC